MTNLILRPAAVIILAFALTMAAVCSAQNSYNQQNLVSDIPGLANHTDPNLVNPWGIASSSGSPFWVSDNDRDVSTLYNSTGMPLSLVVSIPPGAPTGVVFNNNAAGTFNGDFFLFATETGAIAGWRGALGTTAETLATVPNAVFKGIATATVNNNAYIYAADFFHGNINVLPNGGAPSLTGNFTDPNIPAGFAPFNIQNINGQLLVTYALQDADKEDDVPGPGNGFVDVFDLNGNFVKRLISDTVLDSPWGLAIAPGNFGAFSNDLLVGNFGNGMINAFNPNTGAFLGTLQGENGPITIEGLWGLRVGNGGNGGDPDSVFFTAGIPDGGQLEDHGLFGRISVPDSGTTFTLLLASLSALLLVRVNSTTLGDTDRSRQAPS